MLTRLTKSLTYAVLIVLTVMANDSIAQTRLGLHVTQEELNIWRQRAQSGPYKSEGDVRSHSPGDWDRIVSNKNSFLSNPSAHRWVGQTSNSCVTPESLPAPSRNLGRPLMEAAFYYLVNEAASDRESVRVSVRDELLAQAATAGTNYANTSRWCTGNPYGPLIDENPGFDISNWMTRLLFAYDYIRSTLSATHQTTLDAWFLSWANFTRPNIDGWLASARFPNRGSDNYSNPTNQGVGGADFKKTHYNGFQSDGWIQAWNNRSAAYMRYIALAGIMFDNATHKASAKRYFKESIKYATFSDGTIHEFYRWEDNYPSLGWTYGGLMIGSLATIADAFARTGDLELYNYSTSEGYNGTAGGPKNLGQMIAVYLGYVNGTVTRYGTSDPAQSGNSNYRIGPIDNVSGESYADDHYFAQANVFYRSMFNKSIYLRTATGAPPYPAGYSTGGWTPFTGEWGIYPGMLFQFGQMEAAVWPYAIGGSQLPTINFSADPATIAGGQSSTLTWSTSNATSCSASGGWTGTKVTSGTQTVTPTQSTIYTLACTGSSGSATQSTAVTVFTPSQTNTTAIKAGGSSFTAADGTIYAADIFYSGGNVFATTSASANTNGGALYQSERFGNFSYAIPVTNGDYTLTLHFAEIYWDAPGQRIFDVLVEGTERISNFDIYAVAGKDTAHDITLPVKVNDGVLNLEFRTEIDNAKLSGLKLTKVSIPPNSPTNLTAISTQN